MNKPIPIIITNYRNNGIMITLNCKLCQIPVDYSIAVLDTVYLTV